MDTAYLHLVTNHIPIIGLPFALFLLIAGIWLRSDDIKAFGLLAFTVLGILTVGVYLLGQGGEDFVEDLAGVSHDAIEDHEKMATISLIMVGLTGILSLFGLIFYKGFRLLLRRAPEKTQNEAEATDGEKTGIDNKTAVHTRSYFPKWLIFAVLVLALLSSGVLGYTGKLGGKIRHTEFYGGAANTEEEDGKKRRGKTDETNQAEPNKETEETAETDAEEKDESGKGRGRNRGRK